MTSTSTIKSITKSLVLSIPYAREKYFQKQFEKRSPSCHGLYRSFEEAAVHSPVDKLAGYDHRVIAEFCRQNLDTLNPADYPVLFWLSQILPKTRFVFELGGGAGGGYYSYRRYLAFPPQLQWVICEVPETARVGQEIALERQQPQLTFTDQREVANGPDLYATFGTLQYIEEPFAEIIGNLRRKPPHILINRVPLSEVDGFVTLQNNGCWFSPYKVDNKIQFFKSIEMLGYEVVDQWEMTRPNNFLSPPGDKVPSYHGAYFRLKD